VMEGPDRLGLKTPARDQPPILPPRAKQGEHMTWAVLESDFETYDDASYQLPYHTGVRSALEQIQ